MRAEADGVHFWLDTSRQRSRPWGLFGGGPGSSARCELSPGATPIDHGYTMLNTGDSAAIETAGAGGYGDPARRLPQAVADDLQAQKISTRTAEEYLRSGVQQDPS